MLTTIQRMKDLLNQLTHEEQEFAIDILAGFVKMQKKKRIHSTGNCEMVTCQDTENENYTS